MSYKLLRCPNCGGDRVTVEAITTYMANSGEHYCHSVKPHDPDTRSHCLDPFCNWSGYRMNLVTEEEYDNTNN
jgi:hypothetical protein